MTEKQAYKILTNTPIRAKENHVEYSRALEMAVFALGKQIPESCVTHKHNLLCVYCPDCGSEFGVYVGVPTPYCSNCGQRLDWRNAE